MSTQTSAHSVTREPGILCDIKNSLSVIAIMLAVSGLIAGTIGDAGAGSGGLGVTGREL